MVAPVQIEVYDRSLRRMGTIGAPISMIAAIRHNAASTVDIAIPNDSPRLNDVVAEGAVIQVLYPGVTGPLISGPVTKVTGTLAAHGVTITVLDQFKVIQDVLGWPVPGAALTSQNVTSDVRTGPVETIVKGVIGAAMTRLGLPYTMAPDLGRGPQTTGSWRMVPLADVIIPMLLAGGVGLSVQLRPAVAGTGGVFQSPGWVVDCYMPRTYPRALSDLAGTLTDWTLEKVPPSATRLVLGAAGTDINRTFIPNVDTAAEALWGQANVAERFVDQSQVGAALATAQAAYTATPNATTQAALTAAQNQYNTDVAAAFITAKTAGQAVTSLAVTLSETATVRYGDAGLLKGDIVPVTAGSQTVTATLTECQFTWDAAAGFVVTPMVGQVLSTSRQLGRVLARLRRDVRSQQIR